MSDHCTKHSNHQSFASESLMYFVNEYHVEDYPACPGPAFSLASFQKKCIFAPIEELATCLESPTFAYEVEKMIISYNWYITNRYWGFQLLYPLVSFLRIFYAVILDSPDVVFHEKLLSVYLDSAMGEVI